MILSRPYFFDEPYTSYSSTNGLTLPITNMGDGWYRLERLHYGFVVANQVIATGDYTLSDTPTMFSCVIRGASAAELGLVAFNLEGTSFSVEQEQKTNGDIVYTLDFVGYGWSGINLAKVVVEIWGTGWTTLEISAIAATNATNALTLPDPIYPYRLRERRPQSRDHDSHGQPYHYARGAHIAREHHLPLRLTISAYKSLTEFVRQRAGGGRQIVTWTDHAGTERSVRIAADAIHALPNRRGGYDVVLTLIEEVDL